MYYKSIMKRRYDWCKLKNTRTHKTLSLPPPTLGTSLSMAPQGWPVGLLPDSITDWTRSHIRKCAPSICRLSNTVKTYPSSEKTQSFLSGSVWVWLNLITKRGSVSGYEMGHAGKTHGSHMRCVRSHVTDGDKMLATCLCPLILVSDHSRPPWPWLLMSSDLWGPHSAQGAHKQQLQRQSFGLGSNLQNRMFLRLKKQARKTESYHVSACSGKIWP